MPELTPEMNGPSQPMSAGPTASPVGRGRPLKDHHKKTQHGKWKKLSIDKYEAFVAEMLGQWASEGKIPSYTSRNPDVKSSVCSRHGPGFIWELGSRVILLYIDENQNSRYTPRCEMLSVSGIVKDYGGIPVHVVRYNPDVFRVNGKIRVTQRGERMELLKKTLVQAFDRPNLENRLTVQHLWYDQVGPVDHFDVTQTFQTLEDYETWIDFICLGDGQ
jgi:hypothetical protein